MTFRAGKEGHTYFMMDEKEILDNIKHTHVNMKVKVCSHQSNCKHVFAQQLLTLSALTQPFTGKY